MKIKSIFGFCSYKGCRKRYDFDVEIKAGENRQEIRLCEEHARRLVKGGVLKGVTFNDVTMNL